jgi:GT2 family glycosyltransferase
MSANNPSVSIIIPTHNRLTSLLRTLDALSQQTHPASEIEVVVVADGCTDGTQAFLQTYSAPFSLEIVEQGGYGAAAARNAGAKHARGHLLLFLDDDVVPTPGLISAHLRAHQQRAGQIVLGPYPTALKGRPSFYHIQTRQWWASKFDALKRDSYRFTYRDLLSGNLSLEKAIFQRLGGFDPTIKAAGGEDYEFGVRVIKAGIPLCFVEDALANHYDHDTTDIHRSMKRFRQEGRADVQIGRRHIELRNTLHLAKFEAPVPFVTRLLRSFALERPGLGNLLASSFEYALRPLEKLRMRGTWSKFYGQLRSYWYWRGVRDELGGRTTVANFVQAAPVHLDDAAFDLELNLREGLSAAMRQVDEGRPLSIRLRYGDHIIGRVAVVPGAEPLRGAHLRFILAKNFAWPLACALAIENALPSDSDDPYIQLAFPLFNPGGGYVHKSA